MIRILFSLFFWVLIGRWWYAEVKMVLPSATPVIDFALEKIQIPTHDKWNTKSLDRFLAGAKSVGEHSLASVKHTLDSSARGSLRRSNEQFGLSSGDSKGIQRLADQSAAFVRF